MFDAAFWSRSCTEPHSPHVHSLIPRSAIPFGLCSGRQPQAEQTSATESLVHFRVPSSARNRFVAQHVSEGRPACIEHGLRQSGFGEPRGAHVSHRDVVEVSHDAMRGFVQEVVPCVLDVRVDVGSEALFVRALRLRQLAGKLGELLGVLDLLAGGESAARSLNPRSMPTSRSIARGPTSGISTTMFTYQRFRES